MPHEYTSHKKQIPYDSTYVRYLESYRQKVEWSSSGVGGGGGVERNGKLSNGYRISVL